MIIGSTPLIILMVCHLRTIRVNLNNAYGYLPEYIVVTKGTMRTD
jgi:hypothetical protein